MTKKRGTAWDGVKNVYHVHQALEVIEDLRQSGGRALGEVIEVAMMLAVLAAVIGLFYLLG
jgi:hypothetical protein